MLMLSSMLDYSSAMEDALLTKLDMTVFFLFYSFFCFVFFKQHLPSSTYNVILITNKLLQDYLTYTGKRS